MENKERGLGRMIRQDISKSHKVASLSPQSLSLFCLLIPHFNAHGKMNGETNFIKGQICPLIRWMTPKKIEKCLIEISAKTNVKWFKKDGLSYLHSLNWNNHQQLRDERLGKDTLPSYEVQEQSRSNPGLVRREGEGKGEGEGEGKEQVEDKEISSQISDLLMSFSKNGLHEKIKAYLEANAQKNKSKKLTIGRQRTLLLELSNSRSRCNDLALFEDAVSGALKYNACNIGYVNAIIRNKKVKS